MSNGGYETQYDPRHDPVYYRDSRQPTHMKGQTPQYYSERSFHNPNSFRRDEPRFQSSRLEYDPDKERHIKTRPPPIPRHHQNAASSHYQQNPNYHTTLDTIVPPPPPPPSISPHRGPGPASQINVYDDGQYVQARSGNEEYYFPPPPTLSIDVHPPSEIRSEIVIPDRRGVGTLAQQFEKSARLSVVQGAPLNPPPKPLFHRDDHRERLREIDNEVNRNRQQYDYDYSAADRNKYAQRKLMLESQNKQRGHLSRSNYQQVGPTSVMVPPSQYSDFQDEPIYDIPPPLRPQIPHHQPDYRPQIEVRPEVRSGLHQHQPVIEYQQEPPIHQHQYRQLGTSHPREVIRPPSPESARRANSSTQTNETKQVQTDSYENYQANSTLNVARCKPVPPTKPGKKVPPRPKTYLGVERSDSGGNWSAADSDFQYAPTNTSSSQVHYNHDYEDNAASIPRSAPSQSNLNPSKMINAMVDQGQITKSKSLDTSLNEPAAPQPGGGGRVFKFVVSGPPRSQEHAKFSAPFVKQTHYGIKVLPNQPAQGQPRPAQPIPNPRRSSGNASGNAGTTGSGGSSDANKMIYAENKPGRPVPRTRRRSASDLLDADVIPEPSRQKGYAQKPSWNPPRPTAKPQVSKFSPKDIHRYSPTPIAETEPIRSSPKGKTYGQSLDEFREKSPRSSGKTRSKPITKPTQPAAPDSEPTPVAKSAPKYDSEPDSRARRMRDKAKRHRSTDRLDKVEESRSKPKSRSKSRKRSKSRARSRSSSHGKRGRSKSRARSRSSSHGRRARSKSRVRSRSASHGRRGRSKSRRRSPSSSPERNRRGRSKSRHNRSRSSSQSSSSDSSSPRGRARSKSRSRRRSYSSDRKRSKSKSRKERNRDRYEPSVASSYMQGYSQSHYKDALRSGMTVQMVKNKPRGWVADARRRHYSPSDDPPSTGHGSTSDWVQDQTRYRVNNPHGGMAGRPIQHSGGHPHGPPGPQMSHGHPMMNGYPPMGYPPPGPRPRHPYQPSGPYQQPSAPIGPRIRKKSELAAYYRHTRPLPPRYPYR